MNPILEARGLGRTLKAEPPVVLTIKTLGKLEAE